MIAAYLPHTPREANAIDPFHVNRERNFRIAQKRLAAYDAIHGKWNPDTRS